MNPFFSIIIPCYNHENFVKYAIESILCQDFSDFELILIDDGSTDCSLEILKSYRNKDARIVLISQINNGLSYSRNVGLNLAKGEFVLFLDADDFILSGCLRMVYDNILLNPFHEIYQVGYSYYLNNISIYSRILHNSDCFLDSVLMNNIGPCHSLFFRLSLFNQIGNFDFSLNSCEDWDLWIRAAKSGFRIYSINEVLVAYRYVAGSMSKKPKKMYEALCEVSSRAAKVDPRISITLPLNKDYKINLPERFKIHFINCLGVSLFQGLIEESKSWFAEESSKYMWSFSLKDWEGLSSNLSFKHFLTPELNQKVLTENLPVFQQFFISIGYSENETKKILKRVFAAQFKKRNHFRFGKILGGIINKLSF